MIFLFCCTTFLMLFDSRHAPLLMTPSTPFLYFHLFWLYKWISSTRNDFMLTWILTIIAGFLLSSLQVMHNHGNQYWMTAPWMQVHSHRPVVNRTLLTIAKKKYPLFHPGSFLTVTHAFIWVDSHCVPAEMDNDHHLLFLTIIHHFGDLWLIAWKVTHLQASFHFWFRRTSYSSPGNKQLSKNILTDLLWKFIVRTILWVWWERILYSNAIISGDITSWV